MALFVRAANPIWFMVDLEGLPLNDEYWAIFLTNTLPYIPQAPTHDPEGLIPWSGGKVQFQPGGTLPNELYFNPDLVYRIEIRHGQTQADPLIYEINNFVPENGSTGNSNNLLRADNQITNPQFQNVYFTTPFTYTQALSGDYSIEVAPGWFLDLVGQGTTVISQLTLSGTDDIQGNPPYAIRINNTGWESAQLRQRFTENGAIYAGGAITMSVTARAQGSMQELTASYSPSSPGTPIEIFTEDAAVGTFTVLSGAINLPASTNSNTGDAAYVDIILELEATGIIDLTNIQLIGQSVPLPADFNAATDIPLFEEQTIERQLDQEFHVYADSLIRQSKGSLLVAWNFALNPWQLRNPALTGAVNNGYVTDQTILIQQNYVENNTNSNMSIGQATFAVDNFALAIEAVGANNQFGFIQYVDPSIIRPYWGKVVSSLVTASLQSSHGSEIRFKLRLFYVAGLPAATSRTVPVASWVAGDDPVFAAGYTEIVPPNDPIYTLTNEVGTIECPFERIPLPESSNTNMTLGIMVYTIDNMDPAATADLILINDISLAPNDFAARTQAQTFDEVLRQCEFYYEKSYNDNFYAGSSTNSGLRFAEQLAVNSSPIDFIARSFGIQFNTLKRALPVVSLYSAVGTGANVSGSISNAGAGSAFFNIPSTNWTATWDGQKSVAFIANTVTPLGTLAQVSDFPEAFIAFHFIADSRLGV